MEKMGKAINIDIYSDLFMPYFFYKCDCSENGTCTLEEYSRGISYFKKKTFKELTSDYNTVKTKLISVEYKNTSYVRSYGRDEEDEKDEFKKFYLWLFEFNNFNKKEKKDKKIQFEIAKFYWNALFCGYNFIRSFIEYLENEIKVEFIKHDQWNCLLELVRHSKNMFPKDYSLDDSWPTLFDDFYKYYCKINGIEVVMPQELLPQFNNGD